MAKRDQLVRHFDQSRIRYFSIPFKKKIVEQVEKNLCSVSEVSKEYGVSRTAVYNWVYAYSSLYKRGFRQVIEPMSDTKRIKELRTRIKELERVIGQKQMELEFKEKIIELAEELYGIDIKKKYDSQQSSGFGNSEKNTDGA